MGVRPRSLQPSASDLKRRETSSEKKTATSYYLKETSSRQNVILAPVVRGSTGARKGKARGEEPFAKFQECRQGIREEGIQVLNRFRGHCPP